MKIWVDITNSPHVVIFRPLIDRMRARGHEVVVTARDFAQTIGMLDRFEIPHITVGAHGGGSRVGKARAMGHRSLALARFARRGGFDVAGDLTIRGVTKAIVLPVAYLGAAKDPWGNEKLAFEAEIVLNRKDFGLTWNATLETGGFLVGDEVRVTASVQAQAA